MPFQDTGPEGYWPESYDSYMSAAEVTELGFLGAFGPPVSALLVTAAYEGGAGVKDLLLRAVDHRFAKRSWLVILLFLSLPVFESPVMAGAIDGVIPPSPLHAEPWMAFPIFFEVLITSGPLEEGFEWRGYALPRLQVKYSALASSLILGFL